MSYSAFDKSFLQNLINNNISESKILDYKRDKIGRKDTDKKEFLFDVSSFANAVGGNLILGIGEGENEEKGFPKSIEGIDVSNIDDEKLYLEQLIYTGIEPKIFGITIHFIELDNKNKYVIVINIPKSYSSPHMVTFNKTNKFYTRNFGGKVLLDVSELRNMFGLQQSQIQWIKNFRVDRISKIVSDDTPLPLYSNPCILIYIVPLNAYNNQNTIDLTNFDNWNNWLKTVSDIQGRDIKTQNGKYNFDGFICYGGYYSDMYNRSNMNIPSEYHSPEYTQIFRNGMIEAIWSYPFFAAAKRQEYRIPGALFEEGLINAISYYLRRLNKIGIQPPLYVMLTLIRMSKFKMVLSQNEGTPNFDKDIIIIPETTINNYNEDITKLLKESFDIIWNTVGQKGSIYYDEDNNRIDTSQLWRLRY